MAQLTHEDFLRRSKEKHNNKYDYSKSKYIRSDSKIIIICKQHGEFSQIPSHHMKGIGCRKCSNDNKRFSHKDFINKINLLNSTEYKLISKYTGYKDRVLLETKYGNCYMYPESLLSGGQPSIKSAINKSEYFINMCKEVHGNTYNYDKVTYKTNSTEIIIKCKIHGDFLQTPNNHLSKGSGCPKCKTNFAYTKTSWLKLCEGRSPKLYVIRCWNDDEEFIKIGITSEDNINKRFSRTTKLPYKYEVLKVIEGSAEYIFNLEKRAHSIFRKYKYIPNIKFGGYTECFELINITQ